MFSWLGQRESGKSSTINALFGDEIAKVGKGSDPETMEVDCYTIGESKLRFWDSPGLGDGIEADQRHARKLIDLLYKTYTHDDGTWGFIDLVLVILDGSSRDLGTSYQLINEVIIPCLGQVAKDRLLVAINQCDMAMKGRYWDEIFHRPEEKLKAFLEEKAHSTQKRILESTGQRIHLPVYYSALENYNLTALMDLLIQHIPSHKRSIYP